MLRSSRFRRLAVVLGVALVWSLTPVQAVAATPSLG